MGKDKINIKKLAKVASKKGNNKVTNLDNYKDKQKGKNKKQKNSFYYSFLTIILLICLVQLGFSAILNISKTIAYNNKITTIKKIRDDAELRNKRLRKELSEFSSTSSLEAIARNNLKMAGDDEVLIIINKDKEVQTQKKKKNIMFEVGKHDE